MTRVVAIAAALACVVVAGAGATTGAAAMPDCPPYRIPARPYIPPQQYGPVWRAHGSLLAFDERPPRDTWTPTIELFDPASQRRWSLGSGSGATWSPSGNLLLFSRTTTTSATDASGCRISRVGVDLVVSSSDGRARRALTDSPDAYEMLARWSPDGSRIAYVVVDGDSAAIAVIQADGGTPRTVISLRAATSWIYDLAWSPDGTRIAFARSDAWSPGTRLWVVDVDGSRARLLTHAGRYSDTQPRWSPDGKRIAFVRSIPLLDRGHGRIWVMDRDGSRKRMLSHHQPAASASDTTPEWAHDGKSIAFLRSFGRHGSHEYAVGLDGAQRAVAFAPSARSADGRFLVGQTNAFSVRTRRIWVRKLPSEKRQLVPW